MSTRRCPICEDDVSPDAFGTHLGNHSTLDGVDFDVDATWLYAALGGLVLTVVGFSLAIGTRGPNAAVPEVLSPVGGLLALAGFLLTPYAMGRDLALFHEGFMDAPLLDKVTVVAVLVPMWGQLLGIAAFLVRRTLKARRLDTVASRSEAAREDRSSADAAMGDDDPDRADDAYERALEQIETAHETARSNGFAVTEAVASERRQLRTLLDAAERREDELEAATAGSARTETATAATESTPPSTGASRDTATGSTGGQPTGGAGAATGTAEGHAIPETVPRAPDVDVDYDDIGGREPIGSGANADVSRATVQAPDGPVTVALKEPRASGTLHAEDVERLMDEAETWSKLDDNDHVVGLVDYGAQPVPWLAMEYMDAGNLGDRAGTLDLPQALWTAIAVTKGVRHAHRRGVAHLDLKPANVLFRSVEGAWAVPKVADWGLSEHLLDASGEAGGMTPQYAAPEQFDDDFGPTDDITDVYQLGAVFYELFTGRPPFEGTASEIAQAATDGRPAPPSEVADVPPALDDALLTALATEKDDRYDNVAYLRDRLQELFDGL